MQSSSIDSAFIRVCKQKKNSEISLNEKTFSDLLTTGTSGVHSVGPGAYLFGCRIPELSTIAINGGFVCFTVCVKGKKHSGSRELAKVRDEDSPAISRTLMYVGVRTLIKRSE